MTTGDWLILISLATFVVAVFTAYRQEKNMASIADLSLAVANSTAAIDRAVPIIRDAANRIDPAALDPIIATITAKTAELVAVLPPV